MPDRCKAFFAGLEVQVSWSMTRSHGTAPDTGQLTWEQGTTLPSSPVGDLVLKNGDTTVLTFKDCLLLRPQEKWGQHRQVSFSIQDRRWKWKTPRVFGQYNVRDDAGVLVTDDGNQKNARELATILLSAMGETIFDVSALPEDINLAPHVQWHYEPATAALEKLCALYACSVVLMNDNSVKIVTLNVGTEPNDVNLMRPAESGLITNLAPDYVTAYAGDTWFESWLTTEAVGMEMNGQIVPIEMLSYRPDGGFKNGDPKMGYGPYITAKLRGTTSQEVIDKTIEACNRSVFRMFRITGFPEGQLFFPGFTLEEPVSTLASLPATGDPAKVYRWTSGAITRTIVWTGSEYRGVTIQSNASVWVLVDAQKIWDLTFNPIIDTGTREECEQSRITATNTKLIVVPPRTAAIDHRLLLPLLGTRIEGATDEFGRKQRKAAEICGLFHEDDSRLRNKERLNLGIWKRGFSVDAKRGYITLGAPAYKRAANEIHPDLYLRIGYGYRWTQYGMRYHRRFRKATGNTLGVQDGVVPRTDVNEYRIVDYGSDYNDLSIIDAVVNNTAAIDSILDQAATENIKQYQNYAAPKRKEYTPLRAIDLNGKVLQMTYQGGHGQIGVSTASIGDAFNITQTPAKAKQLMEVQKRQAESALQEFRAQQAVIGNIQPEAPGPMAAFDASNIA